jgi:hypothetical protein
MVKTLTSLHLLMIIFFIINIDFAFFQTDHKPTCFGTFIPAPPGISQTEHESIYFGSTTYVCYLKFSIDVLL